MNDTYTKIINHLASLANDNDWQSEASAQPQQSSAGFTLSYTMVSRDDSIESLFRDIAGTSIHYCRSERNAMSDWGPYLDRAIIQVDEQVFRVEMYWPEYCGDECDASISIWEVPLNDEAPLTVIGVEIKQLVRYELSSLADLLSAFPSETAKTISDALQASSNAPGSDRAAMTLAMDKLSQDVEEVSVECAFKAAIEHSPRNGLLRISWDIDWGYDDAGSSYPYATSVEFVYQSATDGEFSVRLQPWEDPDFDDVPDVDLSAMTGFPVIDEESRGMVLGYYCEEEPLFQFDVADFEYTALRAWRLWGTQSYSVTDASEHKEAA